MFGSTTYTFRKIYTQQDFPSPTTINVSATFGTQGNETKTTCSVISLYIIVLPSFANFDSGTRFGGRRGGLVLLEG